MTALAFHQLHMQHQRITFSELADGQKRIKVKMIKKKDRKTNTGYFIIIKALDNTNAVLAECTSNVFTVWSHSRYLEGNSRDQRRILHRHVDNQKAPKMEKEHIPAGFALSCLGSQQISGRILTGQFVRFPFLYFGDTLRKDVLAKVEVTLVQMPSYQPSLHFPLELYSENEDFDRSPTPPEVDRSPRLLTPPPEVDTSPTPPEIKQITNYVPEYQDIPLINPIELFVDLFPDTVESEELMLDFPTTMTELQLFNKFNPHEILV